MKKPEIFYFKVKKQYEGLSLQLQNRDLRNINEKEKKAIRHLSSVSECLRRCIPFFIKGNMQDFYDESSIEQEYVNTLKLPFDEIFVSFEYPITVKIGHDSTPFTLSGIALATHDITLIVVFIFSDMEVYSIQINKRGLPHFLAPGCEEKCPDVIFQEQVNESHVKTFYKIFGEEKISTIVRDKNKIHSFYDHYLNSPFESLDKLDDDENILFEMLRLSKNCAYAPSSSSWRKVKSKPCVGLANAAKLMNLAINTINFLNATNVKKVPFISSTKSLREKGGEEAIRNAPPEYYICMVEAPSPQYKQTQESSSDRQQFKFSFDVRGHFRHLQSDFYKHKKGQMIWVPPFVKGEGVYIPKSYHFVEKTEE